MDDSKLIINDYNTHSIAPSLDLSPLGLIKDEHSKDHNFHNCFSDNLDQIMVNFSYHQIVKREFCITYVILLLASTIYYLQHQRVYPKFNKFKIDTNFQ